MQPYRVDSYHKHCETDVTSSRNMGNASFYVPVLNAQILYDKSTVKYELEWHVSERRKFSNPTSIAYTYITVTALNPLFKFISNSNCQPKQDLEKLLKQTP